MFSVWPFSFAYGVTPAQRQARLASLPPADPNDMRTANRIVGVSFGTVTVLALCLWALHAYSRGRR